MLKETIPTENYLKAVTGKFDLEIIFTLILKNKGIVKYSAIPKCTSVILLNLSNNQLLSISQLSPLSNLKYLDLSFNQINSIDGIENLLLLRNVKLHGNNISKLPEKFSSLKRLEKLTFQLLHEEKILKNVNSSNPLCKEPNYRNNILSLLPNLKMLDCIGREIEPFDDNNSDGDQDNTKKIDFNKFNFDFSGNINPKIDDVISKEYIKEAKKEIQDKYDEFERNLNELKKSIQEMKE